MGLRERIRTERALGSGLDGLFPRTDARNMRFAINFFTSITLGGLTEDLRAELKAEQARVASAAEAALEEESSELSSWSDDDSSDSDSSSSSTEGDGSDSDASSSDSEYARKKRRTG